MSLGNYIHANIDIDNLISLYFSKYFFIFYDSLDI